MWMKQLAAKKKVADKSDHDRPKTLKKWSEWQAFWDSWVTYMQGTTGAADIPITYVFRDEETVTQEDVSATYPSNKEKYHRITALRGTHYEADNEQVWQEIKIVTQGGPGWDYIKKYEKRMDGRAAVMELKRQANSTHGSVIRSNDAYDSIAGLSFNGPKKLWTFEQYVNGHIKAHNELLECGIHPEERWKIKAFLDNITDDQLGIAKANIAGSPDVYDTFDKVQRYVSLIATSNTKRKRDIHDIRKVASVTKASKGNQKKFSGKLEAKSYPPAVWRTMSQDQRDKVSSMRRAKKAIEAKGMTIYPESQKRKASEVKLNVEEVEEETPLTQAGKQFGRSAHKKQKKDT